MRWLDGIIHLIDRRLSKLQELVEQAPGVGDIQGGLACCSPWGLKESDTTEQLKRTELIGYYKILIIVP